MKGNLVKKMNSSTLPPPSGKGWGGALGSGWSSMYFKTLWRYLIKNKTTSIINILGLSLGIVFCLIIYLVVQHELGYDTFHPDKERIYRVYADREFLGNKDKLAGIPNPLASALHDEISGVESVVGFYNYYAKVKIPAQLSHSNGPSEGNGKVFESPTPGTETSDVIVTGPRYFDIFQYKWLAGNAASFNAPNVTVLAASKAHKYFGRIPFDEMLGKEVVYNDGLHTVVGGIVGDWTQKSDFIFTDFISEASIPGSILANSIDLGSWGMWSHTTQAFVKLAPAADLSMVESQLAEWGNKHLNRDPESEVKMTLRLQPLSDLHFNNLLKDAYSRKAHLPTLRGLVAIAVFILLIAAFNFINLSTAQSIQRSREVGVRKVMGANRMNLITQFIGETFLVTFLATVLAVAIIPFLLSTFRSFLPPGISLDFQQVSLWLFLLGMVVCTTLIAGFYPAKVLSARHASSCIKGATPGRIGSKGYLRQTLTVFQFTISLVLIVCTLIVSSQIKHLLNMDMGFDKDEIVCIKLEGHNHQVLAEKIKQYPYVKALSIHLETPASERHAGTFISCLHEGQEKKTLASLELCDENYIPLYGLKIIAGRNLYPSNYMKEAVINETCARALGFDNPADAVGQMMNNGIWDGLPEEVTIPEGQVRQLKIVGVVSDFHLKPLYEAITPMFISATSQITDKMSVKLSTTGKKHDDVKRMLGDFESTWKEINPDERFALSFFDEKIASFYKNEQRTAQIFSLAMGIAIFISCMGLFGLAVFITRQRIKEIGIRKVLGASIFNILSMISGDFLKLVLIAAIIASPIAWYAMYHWLEGFASRVPIHWWTFVLAGVFAVVVALITVCMQSFKAATANPVKSLKTE